ncbi:DUF7344 domain-containing protein [Halomontanus rarus]|uniref:DUF7344 domain-containing protein n=1 Tax=Halomontanus rarus TaxID=3034020 RepID=UPI00293BF5C8|nr:hypothetical protein [Halovivax sp. KZCA124]
MLGAKPDSQIILGEVLTSKGKNPELTMASKLSTDTTLTLFADSQRRHLLDLLEENENRTVDELAEQITKRERDTQNVSEDVHQRVVISLVHKHLPMLADHDIVSYNRDRKEVALVDGVDDLKLDFEDSNSSNEGTVQKSTSAW